VPHAYCTSCEATVTVSDGHCLVGHTITTPIIESARGRHRSPSRWEKLRPGRIMTAGHHRAGHSSGSPDAPDDQPQPAIPTKTAPTPRPAPRQKPKLKPAARAARPVPQPQPGPMVPTPVPASQWLPSELATRSVYNSSMLEMLGLDEDAEYKPTITTMTSPEPTWQASASAPTPTAEKVGLDRLPTLSDMHMGNESQTDTGTLIERLWFATEEHEAVRPAADLQTSDFVEAPERTFRWSVIVAGGLVLAIAVTVLQIGVRLPIRLAEQATVTYRAVITEAQNVLPTAREVMLSITDPTVTIEGLSDAAVSLSQLDTASRKLFTNASEPLSNTPPLVSRDPLDALAPLRSDMAVASQDGLAIERRLGDALTYRLVFDRTFALPELPVTASPDEISSLGVELGLGLAGTLDAIAALPNDPAFEAHRAQAEVLATRYSEWQIEYLSALRIRDLTAATVLVEELQTAVERLTAGISVPLQAVAAWATDEIEQYETTLGRLAGSLG